MYLSLCNIRDAAQLTFLKTSYQQSRLGTPILNQFINALHASFILLSLMKDPCFNIIIQISQASLNSSQAKPIIYPLHLDHPSP